MGPAISMLILAAVCKLPSESKQETACQSLDLGKTACEGQIIPVLTAKVQANLSLNLWLV